MKLNPRKIRLGGKPLKVKDLKLKPKKETREVYGLNIKFLDEAVKEELKMSEKPTPVDRPQTAGGEIERLEGKLGRTSKLRDICHEFRG